MREIGTLSGEKEARRLADHLMALQITSKIVEGKDGWAIWVHDENRLAQAGEEFRAFEAEPDSPRYRESSEAARAVRKAAEQADKAHRKQSIDLRDRWEGSAWRKYPLTLALIVISVGLALATDLGRDHTSAAYHALLFADYSVAIDRSSSPPTISLVSHGLGDIRDGQAWRLVTPIFLHFGPWHLIFNMVFLRSFGGKIEFRKGTFRFLLLVLISAVASNVGEYLAEAQSPEYSAFGGMSGVGYALFGYLCSKGYSHPDERLTVTTDTIIQMSIWFFVCASGWIGPVANTAHGVGLIVGLLLGLTRF